MILREKKRFKKSAKAIRGKWYTFQHALDWPGRSSDDMGLMPWLDYTDIDEGGKSFPLIIINIASIKPVEVDVEEASGKLTKKRFQPPSEVPGVNMAGDPNAQMASMLKQLFKAGLTTEMMTSEMKATARKFGMDPDAIGSMDVDDNKRPRKNWQSDDDSFHSFDNNYIASTHLDPVGSLLDAKKYLDDLEQFLLTYSSTK